LADFDLIEKVADLEAVAAGLAREAVLGCETGAESFCYDFDKTCVLRVGARIEYASPQRLPPLQQHLPCAGRDAQADLPPRSGGHGGTRDARAARPAVRGPRDPHHLPRRRLRPLRAEARLGL